MSEPPVTYVINFSVSDKDYIISLFAFVLFLINHNYFSQSYQQYHSRLERTEFILPEVDGNGSVLDSVCMVRDDLLAAKCALHGQIYIFSLAETLKLRTESKYGPLGFESTHVVGFLQDWAGVIEIFFVYLCGTELWSSIIVLLDSNWMI